ncbi:AAA family ATPase [Sphingomonas bacterium]|uniref:AAA family ATPase n=1 Tax=Sphingomonas bacterium TaxID=1895847 RepID=UPI001575DAFE|nr:ATP-binding protein [Sphingomonas bacterium]
MDEYTIVRGMLLRAGEVAPESKRLTKALRNWARQHGQWLFDRSADEMSWEEIIGALGKTPPTFGAQPQIFQMADALSRLLSLSPFDTALLNIAIAIDRLTRPSAVADIIAQQSEDLPKVLGLVAGAAAMEAESAVRKSPLLRLRLVRLMESRRGHAEIELDGTLTRLLNRAPIEADDIIDVLAGPRQHAVLGLDDFAHVEDVDLLVRLLRGAVKERAAGINILIHGQPGTGKTELARTLADAAGLVLHAIGEADVDGDEPERAERVSSLRLAQRLLADRGQTALLFDEMEDLIGDTRPSSGDWFDRRDGSKVFVNRQLETNPVPVIWTSNAIGNVDAAILRRMSFVLKLDMPSRRTALRMLKRVAADESIKPGEGFATLLETAPESSTVLRVAARAGRLAGERDGGVKPAEALVRALRGGELPLHESHAIDLDLFEADQSIAALVERLVKEKATDVSLLLTGLPGTGKTALAHHLARALDRPLIVKRASDLLSKWVGETESQIAEAFAEARRREGVLLFDEADSLLFDRTTARHQWEVGQVNEMLTWLDHHPLPVIAATNHPESLDPATLRRFVFKLHLRPLSGDRLERAFNRFFGMGAPTEIARMRNLTPGDFAVVKRQLRFAPALDAKGIAEMLFLEAAAKPNTTARVGF